MSKAEYATRRRQWNKLQADDATEMAFEEIVVALRAARLKAGVSQNWLARGLPVAGRAVSEWETGAIEPSLGNLILWSRELGLRLVIVGRDGEVCKGSSGQRPGESWVLLSGGGWRGR